MLHTVSRFAMIVSLAVLGTNPVTARELGPQDTTVGRLSALAVLNGLNADLLGHDSATLTLDSWCGAHKLADPAKIVAQQVSGSDKPADAEVRKLLGVDASEPVKYRRVKLTCGDHVLSEADNWYVPARLTADMNHALETTNVAFGRAVQDLHFQRHTISADVLWHPLPAGWEMTKQLPSDGHGKLDVPEFVIQHKAFLTRADGAPFSVVVESYTREVLDFPFPG